MGRAIWLQVFINADDAKVQDINRCLAVRKSVFQTEQGISANLDNDGKDFCENVFHIGASVLTSGGGIIATVRGRLLSADEVKLERMAVLLQYRKLGVGAKLLSAFEEVTLKLHRRKIILHAQSEAVRFYRRYGFNVIGAFFTEASKDHYRMEKLL